MKSPKKVLLIYTGGTIAMEAGGSGKRALSTPKLSPTELARRLRKRVPELDDLAHCDVEIVLNCDSAHIGPAQWRLLAESITRRWKSYDGVVVLHGTDTMAYTASALSFLLSPCLKPVVLTGAQRPLSALRTDARRNLISAVEIAAHGPRDVVQQVCVFFDDKLFQGNRVRKRSASQFEAFDSPKMRALALVGTEIVYDREARRSRKGVGLKLLDEFSTGVPLLHVTPGFPARVLREQLLPRVQGLVLVVFSSGTAPTQDMEFVQLLSDAREREVPVVVVAEGAGEQGASSHPDHYEAGLKLMAEGAHWAGDMTPECAYVKTSWILAQPGGARRFSTLWKKDFSGEGVIAR